MTLDDIDQAARNILQTHANLHRDVVKLDRHGAEWSVLRKVHINNVIRKNLSQAYADMLELKELYEKYP